MAYPADVSALQMIAGSAEMRVWIMRGTDPVTTVRASGYIVDGGEYGMKAGDLVLYVDTNASPITLQLFIVTSVDGTTGAVDLSDGTAVTATDTD